MITRMVRSSIALITVVALSGCVRMYADYVVYEDDTVDAEIIMAFEESFYEESGVDPSDISGDLLNDPELQAALDEYAAYGIDADMATYNQDGYVGFTMSLNRAAFDALIATNESTSESVSPGTEGGEFSREGDFFYYDQPAAELDDADTAGLSPAALGSILDSRMTFTFPGDVVSSTHGEFDGRTVVVELTDLLDGRDFRIKASAIPGSSSESGWPSWATLLVILGIVAVAIAIGMAVSRGQGNQEV